LALPLGSRAQLDGFFLIEQKPLGEHFRPDELELLAWAARQIGLGLQALKVAELEAELAALEVHSAKLQRLVGLHLLK
jgi:hypothetical protein